MKLEQRVQDIPPAARSEQAGGPVAIICGGGALPTAVAEGALRAGRSVHLLPIEGWAEPRLVERFPHTWIKLGQFRRLCRLAQQAGCREVVLIGKVLRPSLSMLRFGWSDLPLLPRAFEAFRGGDDRLLSMTAAVFEEHGFRVLGAHEVAPEILVPEGALGSLSPAERDSADARQGFAAIAAMGPYDIGQAVVVADNHVLAVEAIEGTDDMLARIAEMRAQGRIPVPRGVGVLVKAPKPGQDRRFDLPAIGPQTVANVRRAGLAGIAVQAGEVVIAEPEIMIRNADAARIFVAGFPPAAER
ncbi:MAG TPA: UDP-2,3-diacylglucosamine diphosphatase LpxI [Xanthobacteraceae bacterium]|nr:UDP-2,3-diacylglucosamine diphosphatase LpxI [Xanthobacteraceae bacterium]